MQPAVMNLISTVLLLASCAAVTASSGPPHPDAAALGEYWFMDNAVVSYDNDENTFTLDFPTSSTLMDASKGMLEEEFYDFNCKEDGTGYQEHIINSGITGPDGISEAKFLNGPDGKPQLKFKINPSVLTKDPKLYTAP